ncbi:MAG TPA: hypothetical protein VMM36_18080, partial [Opitutaceae bacterium]|nr:hypothetical protein [Opitutaceae bacterium]
CTDLAATVGYPMQRLYGAEFTVAPLSVLVAPARARDLLEPLRSRGFCDDVQYILEKQLEEAELIVVTKADQLDADERGSLCAELARRFPRAAVFAVSSRSGEGTAAWFRRVLFGKQVARATMEVDYDRYAAGEAKLGWLNAVVGVSAERAFDPDALLLALATAMQLRLRDSGAAIAHLKLMIHRDGEGADGSGVGSAHVVSNDAVAVTGIRLGRKVTAGRVVVNLRAEADPEALAGSVSAAFLGLDPSLGIASEFGHLEFFRPGRPMPTHRDFLPDALAN